MSLTRITAVVDFKDDSPSQAAVTLRTSKDNSKTIYLDAPAGAPYRSLVAWCLDRIHDIGKQVLLKEADIKIPDRPTHGGYPSHGPMVLMTGVPMTLAELQRQTADQLRRDSTPQALLKSKVLKPRKPWPEEPGEEEDELDVITPQDIAATMPPGDPFGKQNCDTITPAGRRMAFTGDMKSWQAQLSSGNLSAPPQDPRLKILSDFVRTAPGRLPQEVQDALVPAEGGPPTPPKVVGLITLECASGIVQCWCGCSKFQFHSDNWTYTCGSCNTLFDSRMPVKPFDPREPI